MLTRLANMLGFEKRATDDGDPFIPMNWNRASRIGAYVTPANVLSNSAVAARCVALRSELGASVPLQLFRRLPNGDRERVGPRDHPLARVLNDLANPMMTAFELREFLIRSLDTQGNATARIERDGAGQVVALWPLEWTRVQVERLETGRIRYRYSGANGPVILLADEVLHIRASSEDGLIGRSPLTIARAALQLGITLSEAAMSQAAEGFKPAGIISHPGRLSPQAKQNLRDMVEKEVSGARNAGRPTVFEEGIKFQQIAWSAADAQVLQSRAMSASDVCFAFNLSPAILGLNESVSYGSAAQAAQDLVTNALQPLCSRIEQAMQRCLLTERGRSTMYIEHQLGGLLRSDPVSRWQTWKVGREIGALSAREVRRMENLGPMDPEDDYSPLRGSSPQQAEPPIASTKT